MYLSPRKQLFVDTASDKFGGGSILNKSQVKETCDDLNIPLAGWFLGQCKLGTISLSYLTKKSMLLRQFRLTLLRQ